MSDLSDWKKEAGVNTLAIILEDVFSMTVQPRAVCLLVPYKEARKIAPLGGYGGTSTNISVGADFSCIIVRI